MKSARILIVEDSFIVSFHLQTTLENEGYTVAKKCESGELALEFVESNKVDLVLMDIMLSGKIDGIEAATVMKRKFNIPVIYITALTDKETINRAKITEPFGYLTKPFEDREIFTVIEMALYKHGIESKLKHSEQKYFDTVNSIGDAVIVIDPEYRVSFLNRTAIAMTQWALNDAIGKSVMDVLNLTNEVSQEKNVNPVQCLIENRGSNRMPDDLILVGKNGLNAPIGESSLSPLLDNNGVFIGLIIVFKDMREKRRHQKLIQELERQRLTAMIEGQEKERARVAKDLHDGLGQMLSAIKMNVNSALADQKEAGILSALLDEAIVESVRISENLLPAKLKDFDLNVCLRSLCNNLDKLKNTHVNFYSRGDSFHMSQTYKVNFYRIAQEALNNAIKYSDGSAVNVYLTNDNQVIRLSIEDNGNGLATVNLPGNIEHNGLVNMRDRTEIMGGKFKIERELYRGTIVTAEVPTEKILSNA